MTSNELIDLLESAGREVRSYSGRGMYGRECVGVEVDNVGELFQLGLELADGTDEDERFELQNLKVSWDSMGMGTILYFPDVGWPKGRKDSDAEDDDDDVVDDDQRSFGPRG